MLSPKHTIESVATAIVRGLEDGTLSLDASPPEEPAQLDPPFKVYFAASGGLTALGLAALAWILAADAGSVSLSAKLFAAAAAVLAAGAGFLGGLAAARATAHRLTSDQVPLTMEGEEQGQRSLPASKNGEPGASATGGFVPPSADTPGSPSGR